MRTQSERAVDLILELAALERAGCEHPARIGPTVFQKILFWTKLKLREQWSVPRLAYFRHNWGAYSRDLSDDVQQLRKAGHLAPAHFRLTPRGLQLAQHWRGLLDASHRDVFAALDATVDELSPLSAEEVKARTYALSAQAVGAKAKYGTLHGVPMGVALLLNTAVGAKRFGIEQDLVEDFMLDVQTTAKDIADLNKPGRSLTEAAFTAQFGGGETGP